MKFFPILAILTIFIASAFAYDVGIKVTVSQDTIAVGTNVTIVKDGTLLYSARTDGKGVAAFNLDQGSYFVYLDRGGYFRHVNLLEVSKSDNITYIMRQIVSSSSAYGQITGPVDFTGATVAAYMDGKIVKRTAPNKDGYYMLLYVPEGAYEIVFGAPGYVEKNESSSLLMSQLSEVNVKLDKTPVVPMAQPAIIVPSAAQKQSVIEILLVRGSVPMSGQTVNVKTPAGDVELTTGADGKAHVNAVKSGKYIFTYGNLSSTTVVEGDVEVPVQKPPVVTPEPVLPPETEQPQKPADTGVVAGVAIVVFGAAIAALGAILFVASKMIKKQKPKAEEAAHEEREAGHKHEASETPGHHATGHKHESAHKNEHKANKPAHEHKK